MLNKKIIAVIAIVAAAGISVIPMMDVSAEEKRMGDKNKIMFEPTHPHFVEISAGETQTVPISIRADKQTSVDIFVSSESKEFEARNNMLVSKFDGGVSASLTSSHASIAEGDVDNVNLVISVDENTEPGVYPLTISMKQKMSGFSNLLKSYIYVTVD